jgi:hypothetical protein
MNTKFISFFCLCIFQLSAYGQNNTDFQWHGFVAQGVINVNHSDFIDKDKGLSLKLTEIGINSSYRLSDQFRVAGQLVYLNGGNRYSEGVRLDYLLLDWQLLNSEKWQVNLFLGRFKNNHWLHSNTRDVPFARPSIILPQSIYFDGFRDIAMGSDGVAFRANYSDNKLGEIDFNLSYGASQINDKSKHILLSDLAAGKGKQDFDAQASIYWRPHFSQWRFGLSLLDSDFDYYQSNKPEPFVDGVFSFQFYTVNAIYEGEQWEFSSELYQQRFVTDGFYFPTSLQDRIGNGIYLQTRYQLNNDITLLARAEKFYLDKNDKNGVKFEQASGGLIPRYFAFQNELTFGFSYDIHAKLRVQFEQHFVQGTGRLNPIVLPNTQINDHKYWQVTALQLMYWF